MSSVQNRTAAQEAADRLTMLRQELTGNELQSVLALTPEQLSRFDEWSRARLSDLSQAFDVDTTPSQKRVSWAMRLVSTLGALALCAAVVLLFIRYWGYLDTSVQLTIVIAAPMVLLAAAEFASSRERTKYFTGLIAVVALAAFIMNLIVVGTIFNITSTERSLLAWGSFALLLAYRYGLRLLLAIGLILLMGYCVAALAAQMGYHWLNLYERPEQYLPLSVILFGLPFYLRHRSHADFPPVYRLVGALTFFTVLLSLAEWGAPSYLPRSPTYIERFYEIAGLSLSACAIWLGILRNWNGIVNTGAVFFILFLFSRLYHWWWDWMPRYLFFAVIGGLGIVLVWAFKRVRGSMVVDHQGVPA